MLLLRQLSIYAQLKDVTNSSLKREPQSALTNIYMTLLHQCVYCGKRFTSLGNKRDHMPRHHKDR
jgi:hypothetical protein